MKISSLLLLIAATLSACQLASAKDQSRPYQQATVVSVQKDEAPYRYFGTATNAPLQAEVHSYDIGLRLNCRDYVVRYVSALNYLPLVFAPNNTVEVSLQKHVAYVRLPDDRELKMSVDSRGQQTAGPCPANP